MNRNIRKYLHIILTALFIVITGVLFACSGQESDADGFKTDVTVLTAESTAGQKYTEGEAGGVSGTDTGTVGGVRSTDTDTAGNIIGADLPGGSAETSADEAAEPTDTEVSSIYVYVCGCVQTPGVYACDAEARVFEAVALAGGMTADAAENSVNMAGGMQDGDMIYIPSKTEAENTIAGISAGGRKNLNEQGGGQNSGPDSQESTADKVNINTASLQELQKLTGIGQTRAAAIITYREAHCGFSSTQELLNVPGIKEGIYSKIKEEITID